MKPGAGPGTRRKACPTIARPMATGDGLLARLPPTGPLAPAAFRAVAVAAARHGNGTLEVTARGSLQVRGLSAETVAPFAESLAGLGIADARPPVLVPPLAGLDDGLDVRRLATAIREAAAPFASRLPPKASIVVDGGGGVPLDSVDADIRLVATGINLMLAIGGTRATARPIGFVSPFAAIAASTAILAMMAEAGRRGRDLDAAAVAEATGADPGVTVTPRPSEPVGDHPLRDGTVAAGIALAFGQVTATTLAALVREAGRLGARAMAPAPGRVLLAIGLPADAAPAFRARAAALGFVTAADDPRRAVVSCPGAPACASGHIAARALAPVLAHALAPLLDGSVTVHLSGCAKGCAHPGPATLVITGTADGPLIGADARAGAGVPAGSDIAAAAARLLEETVDA